MKFKIKATKIEKSLIKKKIFILKYINNFVNIANKNLKKISFLELPGGEVSFFLKKRLLDNFILKNNSFNSKLKLINCWKYFFFMYFMFYLFIFIEKKIPDYHPKENFYF